MSDLKKKVVRIAYETSNADFTEKTISVIDVCGGALDGCECKAATDTQNVFSLLKQMINGILPP